MTTPHSDTSITVAAADPADRPTLLQTTSTVGPVQFSGLFAGFLATGYTQVRLIELQHLGDLATALLVPATLAAAALTLALIRRRGSGRWLTLTAVLLLLATLAISASINTDQQSWSGPGPAGRLVERA